MRDFLSVLFRFVIGWLAALLILCVISVIKYWDVLVSVLASDANVLIQAGLSIFITIFVIVALIRNTFRW